MDYAKVDREDATQEWLPMWPLERAINKKNFVPQYIRGFSFLPWYIRPTVFGMNRLFPLQFVFLGAAQWISLNTMSSFWHQGARELTTTEPAFLGGTVKTAAVGKLTTTMFKFSPCHHSSTSAGLVRSDQFCISHCYSVLVEASR
eukprot:GHVS01028525.1.p1 GENE.GHVS01028525.1~~GHVS01028525.1.p1  ORF type:complete len:145 (+),score=11.02 GHVS01028525.1:531-965(+)